MSNIVISRFVETTLKERTTAYSPLVEAIVNSVESILEMKRNDGKIIITPIRNPQISLEGVDLQDIIGFTVEDNGIGFDKNNRDAFNTLCTDYKINLGGKGLGRFIFLKYFKKVQIRSIYKYNSKYHLREFSLGSKYEIIENETDKEIEASDTKTILSLEGLQRYDYDKQLITIARKILERILVFFVSESFKCPMIILKENDETIILNDLLKNNDEIKHVQSEKFSLKHENLGKDGDFQIEIYKIIYPGNVTSKICLTAHNRLVTDNSLYKYIPEFKENFYETDDNKGKNYIIMAYILGEYLDLNVSLERSKFNFPVEEGDALYPISQQAIEKEAAKIIENVFKGQVLVRRNKKIATVKKYIDESAPCQYFHI